MKLGNMVELSVVLSSQVATHQMPPVPRSLTNACLPVPDIHGNPHRQQPSDSTGFYKGLLLWNIILTRQRCITLVYDEEYFNGVTVCPLPPLGDL